MKILICDDDLMMQKVIDFKLSKEGFEVVQASDGRIAAQILKNERFDLIITDLLMPYLSGLEIVNLVRDELKLSTPIILLSKVGHEKTILRAFELGANDYVTKPFNPDELLLRVRHLLLNPDKKY